MNNPASGQLLTISEMVQRKRREGRSLRDLAADSGGVVGFNTFDKLSKGEVTAWPSSNDTIEAVARALGVDARQVVLGYARQLGIDVAENRSMLASMLPSETENLSLDQARAVANLIKAFTATQSAPAPAVLIDMSGFTDDNIRSVIDLYNELRGRGVRVMEEGDTAMAATFDSLAAALDTAVGAARRR